MGDAHAEGKIAKKNRSHRNLFTIIIFFSIVLIGVALSVQPSYAAAPAAPSNLAATAVSTVQINLTWTDNSTNETGFSVERATSSGGTYIVIATLGVNVTTYLDKGLPQNTAYYYRVRAYTTSKTGNVYSKYSNTASAATPVLSPPTNLTAALASSTQINLSWTDNTLYETTYYVERSLGLNGTFSPIASVGANVATYADTACVQNTTYRYRVRAFDGTNYSPYSNVVTAAILSLASSASANGTISPSGAILVNYGTSQTFTMTPLAGYHVNDVLVDGQSAGAVTSYTFSNITDGHTIAAGFDVNHLIFSNVSISRHTINTLASESTTIFFTIYGPAAVTLKVIPEKQGPGGTPIYQASQNCTAGGAYLFTWDGKSSTGATVPDEAYLYILEATDGAKSDLYSPPPPLVTGSVSCAQDTYDPYKNDPLTVSYTVSQPSRIDISIAWGLSPFKVMNAAPHVAGSYTFDWDGRDPNGKIRADGGMAKCAVASLLGENTIITSGDTVKITSVKTDPYQLHYSFGQFTRIKYSLSRDANITIKLISSTGATITLTNNENQTAGAHEIQWTGADPLDATGTKALLTSEGDYTVAIQAVNPVTGTTSIAKGYVKTGY